MQSFRKWVFWVVSFYVATLTSEGFAFAQGPAAVLGQPKLSYADLPESNYQPAKDAPKYQPAKDAQNPPTPDCNSSCGSSCGAACCPCDPPMHLMGDLFGFCVMNNRTVATFQTTTVNTKTVTVATTGTTTKTTSKTTTQSILQNIAVCNPYAGRVAFKIADNESVLPQDRVFFNYNYLASVEGIGGFDPSTSTATTTTVVKGKTTTTTDTFTSTGGVGAPGARIDANQEIFGFEKTFLNGNASVGMRLPILQQNGDGSVPGNGFGDLSIITKALLYMDRDTGLAFSGGLMITVPTGPAIDTIYGNINSTLLQPYLGYYWATSDFYIQGFVSAVFPTDDHDVTLLLNTLGCGYTVYRSPGQILSSVTPLVEVNVLNPLNHRGTDQVIFVPDLVDLTAGFHLGIGRRSLLSVGATVPVTGLHPFDIGALAQFNYYF